MRIRLLATYFAFMVCSSQAQDIRGTISGTVTDPQGTNVVDAAVVVTNKDTNVLTTLATNSSGFYEAPLLSPGPYQVTVEARGFKKTIRPNLILTMRGEYKIDTTSFDASVGHSIGLNIAFSTKSGTNSLHGSGTEQYWNTRWNAASFFVKQKYFQNIDAANAAGNTALASQLASQPMQPGGHANDYGFTLGGPVYIPKVLNGKNRLFLFFFYSRNKT